DQRGGQPQQHFPDQERDAKIPKVINELSQAARYLRDPRLLSMNEKPPNSIGYQSADGVKSIWLRKYDFENRELALPNLPKEFKEYERIIPVYLIRDEYDDIDDPVTPDYVNTIV